MTIKEINEIEDANFDMVSKGQMLIKGWIRQYRKQTDLCFMNINDGSCPQGIQIICDKSKNEVFF